MFLSRRNFLGWSVAGLLPLRSALALQPGEPSRTARGAALQRAAQALGSEEMNQRYFQNRADGFRLYGSGQMMTAQV